MLTSKQRAYLRGLANDMPVIIQVGKGGIGDNLIKTVSDALEARELIKLHILENCGDPREVAEELAKQTQSEVVAVTGKKAVFYKRAKKKPVIELPV